MSGTGGGGEGWLGKPSNPKHTQAARVKPYVCPAQVVGRVVRGQDALAALNQMDCDEHDAPLDTVRVSACGLTNATGAFETLDEAAEKARRNETPQQAAARLEAEAQLARDAVKCGPTPPLRPTPSQFLKM